MTSLKSKKFVIDLLVIVNVVCVGDIDTPDDATIMRIRLRIPSYNFTSYRRYCLPILLGVFC